MSEIQHRVAFGVLVDGDRALLCHRHPDRRWFPNVWDLPGGHIDDGEAPADTVVRELREELGVEVLEAVLLDIPVAAPDAETHAYLVTRWEGTPENLAPDEHDDLRWVTVDELAGLDLAVPEVETLVVAAIGRQARVKRP